MGASIRLRSPHRHECPCSRSREIQEMEKGCSGGVANRGGEWEVCCHDQQQRAITGWDIMICTAWKSYASEVVSISIVSCCRVLSLAADCSD
eukprot:5918634-Amphidinium_carterae.1